MRQRVSFSYPIESTRRRLKSDPSKSHAAALTVAVVGVVYGDIGTSPLYTMKEVFSKEHGLALNQPNLLGVVSLIVWGLTLIVSLKYVTLILRADNRGEGGIMALMALALSSLPPKSRWQYPLTLVGLGGTALFFGDGVITPAISVLSAIEGLQVATPAFKPFVLPLTVGVLVALYLFQRKGTAGVGKWFGPIMVAWFIALAAMGAVNIARNPAILAALNPIHAFRFFLENRAIGFVALGAIFLAITGAEALYADMGHFGKAPIRRAWFAFVFPALALNYLGQGGLLLSNPAAAGNPFYQQLGAWSIYPLVALSTIATVIASQATISATYSVVQQAMSLGFLPRMKVMYTSAREIGQIYIPFVNWAQLFVVILAVVGFGSSSSLASAYGIAVTMTMVTTTMLTFFVIRCRWKYSLALSLAATGFFLFIDLAFFTANALKIMHGGWFPLALGATMITIMLTWRTGRELLFENLKSQAIPLREFLQSLFLSPPISVPGTGVFFRAEGDGVPHSLLHNLLHNRILHERTIFLTVHNADIPFVAQQDRVRVTTLGNSCYQVDVNYGFMDDRDIPQAMELCADAGLEFELMTTSFFIARHTVVSTTGGGMAQWREALFATMSRNARDAADYFRVPPNRVIELGTQVEI
jgi:KUP system potassium uptake protein